MSTALPVRIVTSAAIAIREAAKWWGANRPKVPSAFVEELERGLQLIASQPAVGAQARNTKLSNVRRIHLARVHYHLYYRITPEPPTVEVLALWHTSRGQAPPV